MGKKIDAITIKELINCTEIDGNIVLLKHVFEEHAPDDVSPMLKDSLTYQIL